MHVHTTDHDQDACPVRPSMDPTIVSWDLRMSPIQVYLTYSIEHKSLLYNSAVDSRHPVPTK